MELHQLRYAVAVADTGNFTRAAELCNITQPSISQQVLNLEREIGHKLFHRLGRKAVLTEAGTVFVERARRILIEVENASKELGDSTALGRHITVGAVQTIMPYFLVPLIVRCRETLPNLTIAAREGFRQDLAAAVVEGDLDLAIVPQPFEDPRVAVEPLFTEPLLLVVGNKHRFARRPEISLADVAGETFISMGGNSTIAEQVRDFFGGHNFQPKVGFRCAQVATLKLLISLGLGISILPQMTQQEDDRGTLTYLRLTGEAPPTRELAIIRHLQRYQSRGVEQFLTALREHATTVAAAAH